MGLGCTSKQHEALMCKIIEHLAAFRGGIMAPLTGNLQEPSGCKDTKADKMGRVRHPLPVNGRCIHAKNGLLVSTVYIRVWNREE